jgi:cytochrome oxidase Cu insertion factor (SCO1/SenC/PrrC family)
MSESSGCMTQTCICAPLGRCLMWLALVLPTALHAQQSLGTRSNQPPNEDLYVYKEIPDIEIQPLGAPATKLSTIWQNEPVLLTMIFTRCAGVCSPFLRSLKTAVADAGGLGRDYRVVVLSFDPIDSAAEMESLANSLEVKSDPGWIFGIAPVPDVRRLATASGFWFEWDPLLQQYDHPSLIVAIDHGKVVRILAGANVPNASLREVVQELRGKFVASYALTGRVAFRCFEYDPQSGRYSLDWGVVLMLLPPAFAMLAVIWAFFLIPKQPKRARSA